MKHSHCISILFLCFSNMLIPGKKSENSSSNTCSIHTYERFHDRVHKLLKTPENIARLSREAQITKSQQRNRQSNLLDKAIRSGHPAFIYTVIRAGVSPHVQDTQGYHPVRTAMKHNNTTTIATLKNAIREHARLEKSQCPHCHTTFSDKRNIDLHVMPCCQAVVCKPCSLTYQRQSPLCPHCKTFHHKIHNLNKTDYNIQRLSREAARISQSQQRKEQAHLLHTAIQSGYAAFVNAVISGGISPHIRDKVGRTPLGTAFSHHRTCAAFTIIKAIRQQAKAQGTDCPICIDSCSNKKDTQLYVAPCCQMVICKPCLSNLRQYSSTCPHCRTTLV